MPKRNNTFRVESEEVQGEGSFVVLRRQSWRDAQQNNRLLAEMNGGELPRGVEHIRLTTEFLGANVNITKQTLEKAVVAWNWVDDEGNPQPIPSAGEPDLTQEEVQFIIRALSTKAETEKN